MFWGIVITIALATLFWSGRVVVGGVLCFGAILFFLTKKNLITLAWYCAGVVLAISSLWRMSTAIASRKTIPLTGILEGRVTDQRSIDTRLVSVGTEHLLLRSSQKPLEVGQTIAFQSRFVSATIPSFSRQHLTLPSFLSEEFAFDRWLATKKYLAWGSVSPRQFMVVSTQMPPSAFLEKIRYTYKTYLHQVFGTTPTAALLLGLTTGDRSGFSRQTYTAFVESGLVHLLAVSGSNVVYVSLFLGLLFFWIPFYPRLLLIGCALIGYGLFCGADSSVVRAISMGILGLLATGVGRQVSVWRLLQITAGSMLLINPLVLWYDLGFLLSFGAVGGILFVSSHYRQWMATRLPIRYDKIVLGRLLPTFGATAGVLPVLILRTGKLSLSSIWINLLVVPLVPVFLLVGGGVLLGDLWGRGMAVLDRMSSWLWWFASRGSAQGMFLVVSSGLSRLVFVGVYGCLLVWLWEELRIKN